MRGRGVEIAGTPVRVALCVATCALIACDVEVFQHARASDAGAKDAGSTGVDCATAAPGTRCDDGNACTNASTCREGLCLAGTTSRECVIMDADAPLVAEQGARGWYYGYWNADTDEDAFYDSDADFVPMQHCGADDPVWRPPDVCGLTRDDDDFRWTSNLGWALQHPETDPDVELPVRRWVSDVSGPVRLFARHEVGGTASDGTRALLLVDGDELWRHDTSGGGADSAEITLELELRVGTVIDMLVHPIVTSAADTTYFELRVEGR
jgi:hypothetical protein